MTALEIFTRSLRALDAAQLATRAGEVAALPPSPLAAEMRLEVEVEQAGRRWHQLHDLAERIGWEMAEATLRPAPAGAAA